MGKLVGPALQCDMKVRLNMVPALIASDPLRPFEIDGLEGE